MAAAHRTTAILLAASAVALAALFLNHGARGAGSEPITEASRGGIRFRAMIGYGGVEPGAEEVLVAVTLDADRSDPRGREPVNIAIVIDRSGSMGGPKLEHARNAARRLIAGLGPSDHLSVIAYSSEVDVLMPAGLATDDAKALALAHLDRMYDDGGTNMSAALAEAAAQLEPALANSAVSRILLIGDGKATEGPDAPARLTRQAAAIGERGISISTVGVGADFDERTLSAIASATRGNYYFADRPGALETSFAEELRRLGATRATGIELEVITPQGVDVIDALGYPMAPGAEGVVVPIADLHDGDRRKVVLRMRLAPGLAARQGTRLALGTFVARYRSRGSSEVSILTLGLAGVVGPARANPTAIRDVERALTAMAIEEATVLAAEGRVDEARNLLDQRQRDAATRPASAEVDSALNRVRERLSQPAASPESRDQQHKANRADAYQMLLK